MKIFGSSTVVMINSDKIKVIWHYKDYKDYKDYKN